MALSNRYKILFILFVALGVYYPVLFAGVNSVDDHRMLIGINDQASIDWRGLFLPSTALYYRPLLMLSFFADKYVWGLSESFMHLENMLLHALNSLLVFLVALRASGDKAQRLDLPLLSALLFALHPINTESVAWISGRTDPFALVFVLTSLLFLLKGLEEQRYRYHILSTFFLLLGCMSKEVAVFFLPVACFISWRHENPEPGGRRASLAAKFKRMGLLSGPFLACGVTYLYLKFVHSPSSFGSWTASVFRGKHNPLDSLAILLKALGFYAKKLFLPFPLNFAIVKIPSYYVMVGALAFIIVVLLLFLTKKLWATFFLSAFFLITPALIVTLSVVTWTPVAERYLYFPSAFFALGIGGALEVAVQRWPRADLGRVALFVLLIPVAWGTASRCITWQDNLSLYRDTQEKSPDFAAIRNELALALVFSGKNAEAERQLEKGMKLDPQKKNVLLYVNDAALKLAKGKPEEARGAILTVIPSNNGANPEALKILARIDEERLFKTSDARLRREIYSEILAVQETLFKINGDARHIYRAGQMALFLNDKRAQGYFEEASRKAPADAFYRSAAQKLAEKLKR